MREDIETGSLKTIRQFDRWAPDYETFRLAEWYKSHARRVLNHSNLDGKRVLDVGCGTGWFLRTLAARNPQIEFLGIDVSPGMIKVARRKAEEMNLSNLRFRVADWEGTIGDVGTFDVVSMLNVVHYFEDPGKSFEKARAIISPGGEVIVLERDTDGSVLTNIWNLIHTMVLRDRVEFLSRSSLLCSLERSGFRGVAISDEWKALFENGKLFTSMIVARGRVERDNKEP